jgi:hypothetical protein
MLMKKPTPKKEKPIVKHNFNHEVNRLFPEITMMKPTTPARYKRSIPTQVNDTCK